MSKELYDIALARAKDSASRTGWAAQLATLHHITEMIEHHEHDLDQSIISRMAKVGRQELLDSLVKCYELKYRLSHNDAINSIRIDLQGMKIP